MLLKDKVVWITGAGRGIGRAIALMFASQGASTALSARTESELAETLAQVEEQGGKAISVPCDVAQPEQVQQAADLIVGVLGPVDILVNNAGYARFKPFAQLSLQEWQETLDVNLNGPFLCIQAVLPKMMERRAGRIINISSVSGLKPIEAQSAYCASKHGLNGLTKTLALELREYNIAVHAICPGGVDTRLSQEAMPHRDKSDWMQPDDVAHTALFLATMGTRATTDIIHLRRFDSPPLGG